MVTPILIKKESKMRFTAANTARKIKFLNEDIEIHKLTVGQVLEIQKLVKSENKEDEGLDVLMFVIRSGCPEFKEYSDADIQSLPMESLTALSSEIMKYSGLSK